MAAKEAAAKHKGKAAADITSSTKDLTDPQVQSDILNPETIEISLFGDKVQLHKLPVSWAIRFSGFAGQVFGYASQLQGSVTHRFGGVLAETFLERFLPYIARALQKPDAIVTDAQIEKLVDEIRSKMTVAAAFGTFAGIFMVMTKQNDTAEALGLVQQPKN